MDSRDIIRAYFRAYEEGTAEAVLRFVHPDHVYHPPAGLPAMDRLGRVAEANGFFAAFSEVKVRIDAQLADDDLVATRLTFQVRHSGEYLGVPATGRLVTIPFMDFSIVRDDRIFEEWAEFDLAAVGAQLGG